MEDVTQHAFEVKRNPQFREIKDEKLSMASQLALIEAGNWDDAICALDQYEKKYDSQMCVMTMYSIELYLKAILMARGINVTVTCKRHDICVLFYKLSKNEQQEIQTETFPSAITYNTLTEDTMRIESFDKALEFISNDFVQLRYQYEIFANGESVYSFPRFITALRDSIRKRAKKTVVRNNVGVLHR